LGGAPHQVDVACVRPDAEVAAPELHHLAGLERLHPAAAVAVGPIHPVVKPPREAVESVLLVTLAESSIKRYARVRLAVAFRGLSEPERRTAREHRPPAPPCPMATRRVESPGRREIPWPGRNAQFLLCPPGD